MTNRHRVIGMHHGGREPKVVTYVHLPYSLPRWLLLDHEIWHAAREDRPHLTRQEVFDLADGDAELNELLLGLVRARPLVAVLVEAGVEEAPAASAASLERVGELREHVVDLLAVLLDAARVETNGLDDALGQDVVAGVLAVLEQAVHEDDVHAVVGQDVGTCGHYTSFSSISGWVATRKTSRVYSYNTQDEV